MSGPKRALKLILMAQMSSTWRTCLHALISPHLPPRYRGNVKHGGLTMLSGKSEPTSTVGLPQNCAGKYWGMSRDHECFSPWGRQFTRCPMHQFSRPRLWDWPRICGKNDQDIVTLMRHNADLLIAECFFIWQDTRSSGVLFERLNIKSVENQMATVTQGLCLTASSSIAKSRSRGQL